MKLKINKNKKLQLTRNKNPQNNTSKKARQKRNKKLNKKSTLNKTSTPFKVNYISKNRNSKPFKNF